MKRVKPLKNTLDIPKIMYIGIKSFNWAFTFVMIFSVFVLEILMWTIFRYVPIPLGLDNAFIRYLVIPIGGAYFLDKARLDDKNPYMYLFSVIGYFFRKKETCMDEAIDVKDSHQRFKITVGTKRIKGQSRGVYV